MHARHVGVFVITMRDEAIFSNYICEAEALYLFGLISCESTSWNNVNSMLYRCGRKRTAISSFETILFVSLFYFVILCVTNVVYNIFLNILSFLHLLNYLL